MNALADPRDALLAALAFEPRGERAGNVTTGAGTLDGGTLLVALVENRVASGAIGTVEAEQLGSMLRAAATGKSPVVLFLDSAGAKVSEGLKALGAFRALYRAGLDAALQGPIAAVIGRNCYGGSSMLAHLAARRLFSPGAQLAMSGPAVIASASGMNPLDEMFRAMAEATLSAAARAKASAANSVWEPGMDLAAWLREALAPRGDRVAAFRLRHEALAARFETGDGPQIGRTGVRPLRGPGRGAGRGPERGWETVRRRDLEKLYDGGCDARESEGILDGKGTREGMEQRFVGLVGKSALNATRAWRFSEIVWRLIDDPPPRLMVYLDCATHAARLEDEKLVLTEFIVDMGLALAGLAARGTNVELTIAGQAGGGVYVALAAPAARVTSLYGANIQVLPGSAVAAILGASRESVLSFDEYRKAGVADQEIKLGFVSGAA